MLPLGSRVFVGLVVAVPKRVLGGNFEQSQENDTIPVNTTSPCPRVLEDGYLVSQGELVVYL